MPNKIHYFILILTSILLTGCGSSRSSVENLDRSGSETTVETVTASPEALSGLDAETALSQANRWKFEASEVRSFVTPEKISITFSDGEQVDIPLPSDKMVVAVAPYINETHLCETHFVSGCQGELVNVPLSVTVKLPDGTVIFDEPVKSMDNGFFELWLPRDRQFNLAIESGGLKSVGTVSTFPSSRTCITTFKLI